MTKIFVVVAHGGQWEDSWQTNLRACRTDSAAHELIEKYISWGDEIRSMALPEFFEEDNWDFEDDMQNELYLVSLEEFKYRVLLRMGVPEMHHNWVKQNWGLAIEDSPSYFVDKLVLL